MSPHLTTLDGALYKKGIKLLFKLQNKMLEKKVFCFHNV